MRLYDDHHCCCIGCGSSSNLRGHVAAAQMVLGLGFAARVSVGSLSPKRSTAAEMGDTRFSTKDSSQVAWKLMTDETDDGQGLYRSV